MKRLFLACLVASHFSLAVADSETQSDPWELLDKAAHAARDLSYKGIFTYQSGTNSRSIEITHMNAGQGEYSRVVMLDGLPREVLSQGSDIVIFSPCFLSIWSWLKPVIRPGLPGKNALLAGKV
jgi:sigma-E factor negative regulatory protein RseB